MSLGQAAKLPRPLCSPSAARVHAEFPQRKTHSSTESQDVKSSKPSVPGAVCAPSALPCREWLRRVCKLTDSSSRSLQGSSSPVHALPVSGLGEETGGEGGVRASHQGAACPGSILLPFVPYPGHTLSDRSSDLSDFLFYF